MTSSPVSRLLLAASCFCFLLSGARGAEGGGQTSFETTYYDVSGATIGELLLQLNARAPGAANGQRFFGQTDWNVTWNYESEQRGSKFVLKSVSVVTRIVYRLPRRIGAKTVDGVAASWNRFSTALLMHEQTHGNNAAARSEKLKATLLQSKEFGSMDELNVFVKTEGERTLAEGRQWDIDFDNRTKHGAMQGAVLR